MILERTLTLILLSLALPALVSMCLGQRKITSATLKLELVVLIFWVIVALVVAFTQAFIRLFSI